MPFIRSNFNKSNLSNITCKFLFLSRGATLANMSLLTAAGAVKITDIPVGGTKGVAITYGKTLSGTPSVVATPNTVNANIVYSVHSQTRTGFDLRVGRVDSSAPSSVWMHWIAVVR